MIVQELQRLQEHHRWISQEEMKNLAKRINVPLHRVHEVASFYPLYRLTPPPKVEVKVCRDMACHIHGAKQLLNSLEAMSREKGIDQLQCEGVSCLGQCDGPLAVVVNDHVYRGLPETELRRRIELALSDEKLPHQHADRTPLPWKIDVYAGKPTYAAIAKFVESVKANGWLKAGDEVIKQLEVSGLVGMGGAGFPTFRKWSAVRGETEPEKFVVCNADESEPGTFKDRELMRRTPWLTLEGIILAGLVTGAKRGYIYVRHEYEEEIEVFREAIEHAKQMGACGDKIFGSDLNFPVEVYVSPGGYVQGEESALLEAMEDRRGEPRNKPPFPTVAGLNSKPTVINNVETLAWVPGISVNGGDWYAAAGTRGAKGMRFVSISGDVNKPGVYEVPWGQTVRELIMGCAGGMRGGQKLKAIAPSGPSGGFLPARLPIDELPLTFFNQTMQVGIRDFDIMDLQLDNGTFRKLSFELDGKKFWWMLGAAFVVYGDKCDMVDQALNCVEFYRNESCGKCVPCRMGSQKLSEIIRTILSGGYRKEDLKAVLELGNTMVITSICGLGMVAANPMIFLMKYFKEDLDRYLR